ncbi:MAG: protein translocase subunit SecD [Zoogloeaceae bacterium]|jgi:preprotein translocase subunit SecD|nr:protein translocase subunit SecD [Zoogloeaceae bacterium]
MNRYPLWKYVVVAIALVIGLFYTLPNFFGEAPAVQVSPNRATLKIDDSTRAQVEKVLQDAKIETNSVFPIENGVMARFKDTDTQLKARDALEKALNPVANAEDYVVALNLLPDTPNWLSAIGGRPMYLGLDLRGGVHFLLQVDMAGAQQKRLDANSADMRATLREKNIRYGRLAREGETIALSFRDAALRREALTALEKRFPEYAFADPAQKAEGATAERQGTDSVARLRPEILSKLREDAIRQNISTLRNRINELGVAEPVVIQQGADRIVVQLPGVQDTGKAKRLLGRTATLELRMVDETPGTLETVLAGGPVPYGEELYTVQDTRQGQRFERKMLIRNQVMLTGDRLTDAQPGFDDNGMPAVHLTLDPAGARIFRDLTRENIGKVMAILLVEKGKGEVVTAPVIRSEIPNGRVMISGAMSTEEAKDVALLLRSGALAAPMTIIEEMTIGPSMGKENIDKGFQSTLWGFVAIVVFMALYYRVFGMISALALSANLLFLVAVLSLLQATLTLPGIAAIALTLGMAIDANVLINERIREELREGMPPQSAITLGYERAFGTILDSNITTLIAGLALLIFGSGPVRGFAVVHCIGIMTSIFSAVTVSRSMVHLVYGRRKKLAAIAIGQIWKPEAEKSKKPATTGHLLP